MQYIPKMLTHFAIVICMFGGAVFASEGLRLQRDGPVARDYLNQLEWMRCSVGQHWEMRAVLAKY